MWRAPVANRTRLGHGCPYCSNRRATAENSLASLYPDVAKQWHPTKNGSLTPDQVVAGSHQKLWWYCDKAPDHEWLAPVADRTAGGRGCACCRGLKPSVTNSLASLFPDVAKELHRTKNRRLTADQVVAGSTKKRWWLCSRDARHAWPAAPETRTRLGSGCPFCNRGSMLDNIRLFAASLKDYLSTLTAAELYAIFQQSGLLRTVGKGRAFVRALATGRFPPDQLDKFTAGEPSLVDGFTQGLTQTLEALDTSRGNATSGDEIDRVVEETEVGEEPTLPVVTTNDVLRSLDSTVVTSADEDAVQFLLASAVSKIWKHAFVAEAEAVAQAEAFSGGDYAERARARFLDEYRRARALALPAGYAFRVGGQPTPPNLMQRLVALQVRDRKRVGNWSGTGAGKTLSAVLASRIAGAGLTVVCCPNSVVEGWRQATLAIFPDSIVVTKTFEPDWAAAVGAAPAGAAHDELDTRPTVPNCMTLHQRLVTLGIRRLPEHRLGYEQVEVPVDCGAFLDEIRRLGRAGHPLALEQILTRARLSAIREHVRPKTLIYTYYVEGIDRVIRAALEEDGWTVGFYAGEDKSGLDRFIEGDLDVLIGSSAIGIGVDGLQQVCNRLIVNVLPWTAAEFEQLRGRLFRQGQRQQTVVVVLPLTYAEVNGERWSWCESKLQRLRAKKSVADAAVDGVVPEGHLRTPAQAYQDVMAWLERLGTGRVAAIARPPIVVPLPDTRAGDAERRRRRYGDFSTMNRAWNQARSETTHERLQANPEEWAQYHTLYREARQTWAVIPYEEMIRWCQQRSGYVIGDFGCGEAKLAEAVSDRHTVYGFDHIAINDRVTACDMAHVPLDNETLDVAILSLSLMGTNSTDYLREAHRALKLDGQLHVIEATSRFTEREQFARGLEVLGFEVMRIEDKWKFTHIRALKTERRPGQDIELRL